MRKADRWCPHCDKIWAYKDSGDRKCPSCGCIRVRDITSRGSTPREERRYYI